MSHLAARVGAAGCRRAAPAPGPRDHVVRHVRAAVWGHGLVGGLVVLLGEFGFSHGAARVALTRLVRRGLIARVRSGRLVHYRITRRCERLLLEGDGRIFSLGVPRCDGRPGRSSGIRSRRTGGSSDAGLRGGCASSASGRRRTASGCRRTTTPARSEGSRRARRGRFATAVPARPVRCLGLPALVARAWDLSGLVDRYEAFVSEFRPYL